MSASLEESDLRSKNILLPNDCNDDIVKISSTGSDFLEPPRPLLSRLEA